MSAAAVTSVEEEITSMTAHANSLASIPVVYPDDHVPDPDEVELPRKMTAFPVDLPPPPKVAASEDSSTQGTLTLNIKSLKPPISFSLANVNAADTVLNVKERLASEHSRAPPVDVQRLLLKGKVLADNKLLKEYLPSSSSGSGTDEDNIINLSLMIKPGATWTAEEKKPAAAVASPQPHPHPHPTLQTGSLSATPATTGTRSGHSRTPSEGGAADQYPVPSLMLSTPGSPTSEKERAPVPIDIADSNIQSLSRPGSPSSPGGGGGAAGGLSHILTRPEFWVRLREFLHGEVKTLHSSIGFGSGSHVARLEADADELFESFLLASKGSLEATDIARIRDAVNITGMAGT